MCIRDRVQHHSSQTSVIRGPSPLPSPSSRDQQRSQHQQLSQSFSGLGSNESWPFRGGAFHLDSRSALVKSMERAAKQRELSDGYRALFGELPPGIYDRFYIVQSSQLAARVTKSSATAEIAYDADETAIQGHSRPSVVLPINAAYMTYY